MDEADRMLIKKFEPIIESGLWQAIAACEEEKRAEYDLFIHTLTAIKEQAPAELLKRLNRLEDIFVQNTLPVKTAYEKGFIDGLRLNWMVWGKGAPQGAKQTP